MGGTIKRLGKLLELGFGVAGQEIIKQLISGSGLANLDTTQSSNGQLVESIFNFVIIDNFSETLEILNEKIFDYVNKIAYIVHANVAANSGAANKNIGMAFLNAWKLPDNLQNKSITKPERSKLANQALLSCIKTLIELHETNNFEYEENLAKSFGKESFKVSLGFGLHVGWAVEGAIGSPYKIDASYLSPNVNISARLESATHQFGVKILMSHKFVELLSPEIRVMCRELDVCTVKGSEEPLGIWTFDLNFTGQFDGGRDPATADFHLIKKRRSSEKSTIELTQISPRQTVDINKAELTPRGSKKVKDFPQKNLSAIREVGEVIAVKSRRNEASPRRSSLNPQTLFDQHSRKGSCYDSSEDILSHFKTRVTW